MHATTSPSVRRRPSTRRLAGGLTSTLAALALLGACGVTSDPPTDDATATPEVAAEAPETEHDDGKASEPSEREAEPAEDSSTAEPESEPAADPEPEAEPEPEPEPIEPQSFSGTGSEVVMLEPLGEDVFYASVTHDGSGNVALWSVDETGQDLDLLVNEIGDYEGEVALNFQEDPAALRVEADGDWTIDLVHLSEAPRWDGESAHEGNGDSVVIVDGVADGLTPVTLTHSGESNFAIWAWGDSYPDLIVNDIGTYEGTTLLPDGSLVLQIQADGTWSITKD